MFSKVFCCPAAVISQLIKKVNSLFIYSLLFISIIYCYYILFSYIYTSYILIYYTLQWSLQCTCTTRYNKRLINVIKIFKDVSLASCDEYLFPLFTFHKANGLLIDRKKIINFNKDKFQFQYSSSVDVSSVKVH